MKKIISILLLVAILIPAFTYMAIFAIDTSEYTKNSILVDFRGTYVYVNVFVSEDGTILMPSDILMFFGDLKRRTDSSEYVYSKSDSSNTYEIDREIRISKNGSYGKSVIQISGKGSLAGTYVNFTDSYTDNEILYLPLEQIVPFLDAKIEITENGILHIYPNPVSIFEALSYGNLNHMLDPDYDNDYYNVLFDLSDSNGCAALSMFVDTIMGRLDRMDFIFDSGTIKDYKALYEKMLVENKAYLSAFDEAKTPYDKVFEEYAENLKDAKDVIEIGKEMFDGKTESLEYMMASKNFASYGNFSDFGDTIVVLGDTIDALYKIINYADVLNKMVDDHQEMLYVVYGNGDVKNTSAGVAANEVADLYGNHTGKKIKSWGLSALRDFASEIMIDAVTKPITPYLVVCNAIKDIIPGDLSKDYNQIYLATIVGDSRKAFANYYNNMSFNRESLNNLRLSLLMTMFSSKYGYDIASMFDIEDYPNSDRSIKRVTVNNWLEKLYLAADSVECCTPEYYSDMRDELSKSVENLQLVGNTTPDNPNDFESSKGLEFTLNDYGGSYYVSGIGTCTDTDVIIPSVYNGLPVTMIGKVAFHNCTSIKSVIIPDSITFLEAYTFYGCTSLQTVTIGSFVHTINSGHFDACSSLMNIEINDNNPYLKSIDGNVYSKNKENLLIYAKGKQDKSFVIPNFVTSIADNAFADSDNLTSVIIPNSVTTIGFFAFGSCNSLVDIQIPSSVTSIGEYAFQSCAVVNVVIPDSISIISDSAFSYCYSLTSVTIPDSVTSIDDGAFYACASLITINFEGTVEQWNAIEFGENWNLWVPATEVVCSNGTVTLD